MPRGKAKLTNSEREILETMWEYGESITATNLVKVSTDKTWKTSSVHLLINSLLNKDYIEVVGFEKTAKNYARKFQPVLPRTEFILTEILDTFNNSPGELFDSLIAMSSKEELISAKAKIEEKLK